MANPNVSFNPVEERIEFDATSELNVNHKVAFNLGAVNDSAWKLRFRLVVNNSGFIASGSVRLWMGLTNADESIAEGTAQNAIFFLLAQGAANNNFQLRTADNEGLDGSTGPNVNFTELALPNTFYCELERVSFTVGNDTVICRLYSAPDYSAASLIEEVSIELLNAREIDGLKYFFVQTDDNANSSSQGATGTIDQIQFWNNTKNPHARIPDFVENYDDASEWTLVGANAPTVDNASFPKQLFFNNVPDGADRRAYRKLPFVLSDEKWVCEYEMDITATTSPGHVGLGLCGNTLDPFDADLNPIIYIQNTNNADPDNEDDIGLAWGQGIGVQPAQATGANGPNGNIATEPVKLYIRLIRVAKDTLRLESYDDPEMTILHDTPRELSGVNDAAENITGIKNLSFLTHGTVSVGGAGRTLTASIHNVRIYNGVNHLDLQRIDAGAVPDFLETFGEYFTQAEADQAWPTADVTSRVNIGTQQLDVNAPLNGINHAIVHDLFKELGRGVFVDDNAWLLRFKIRFATLSFNATLVEFHFGLSSEDETVDKDTAQNFLMWTYNHGNAGNSRLGSVAGANVIIPTTVTNPDNIKQLAVATDYFFEIARTSKTTGYFRQYNDANYREVLEEIELNAITKEVSGLRYLKFVDRPVNVAGNGIGSIDDVEFWNGTYIANDADKIKVKLDDCLTPTINTGNKIHWTVKGNLNLTRAKAQVWQETVLIAESPFFELTADWREYEYELTVAEFNKITDWNKLSIAVVPDTVE